METRIVEMQRISFISSKPFDEIIQKLAAAIGHPDMVSFPRALRDAKTIAGIEEIVDKATGSFGLMEFARFDAGEILRKEKDGKDRKALRFLIGNPIIMKEMAKTVPDAASCAPVTLLVDERPDGVHLSYDLMASLIAPYGSEEALAVAIDLDIKIQHLLGTAAH